MYVPKDNSADICLQHLPLYTCRCTPCTFFIVDQNGVFHVGTDGKVRTICRKCKEKLEDSKEWICMDNPKCEQKDCRKYASYREKGHKRRFCAEHHTEGMISANKKCDLCEKLVNFGAPGGPQTRCAEHKKEGMIGPAARLRKPPPPRPGDPAECSTPSTLPSRPLGECAVPTPAADVSVVGAETVRASEVKTPAVATPPSAPSKTLLKAIRAHAAARGADQGETTGAAGVDGLVLLVEGLIVGQWGAADACVQGEGERREASASAQEQMWAVRRWCAWKRQRWAGRRGKQ